uniref:RUN domain-containing protein n=1 Tax=Meloidogyne enterolobii TaxID=390850 RepID=A0A6V7XV75_MELEN|nr:unnamed protein product [Meloidogyne enterolobii]
MDIVEMNKEAPLLNIISQQNPSSLDVSSTETNEYMKCNDNADMLSEDISRSSSQMDSGSISARIRELEAEQQQLSESLLSLSTKFAQVQFRIQQIASAPAEQREGMLNQLKQFASTSCTNNRNLRLQQNSENSNSSLNIVDLEENVNVMTNGNAANMTHLVEELRLQLDELENFAWRNGHLREGDLPLSELRARQTLILERLREKMHLRVKLAGPDADADENEFRKKLDAELDEAERGLLEKDQLVKQLSTQISDLEQYVQLLQREAVTLPCSDNAGTAAGTNSVLNIEAPQPAKTSNNHGTNTKSIINLARYLWPKSQGHFEKNELKRSALFNHYGDQRAELELAVDKVIHVIRKHQILSVDREERAELTVDELNKVTMECDQEAIVSSVRKKLCPALRALLEHGLQPSVVPANQGNKLLPSRINIFSNNKQHVKSSQLVKIEARRLEHIWDVIILFLEASRAIELRDGVIGNLSDTFKLETMESSMLPHPTSKQILLSTIEYIINSHGRLKRSQDAQWKAFVCAALNRNRLPAWIRIIFRSDIVLSRCYYKWSYTARTGVEDIRPLLEGLQQFNFDLPVDLAVRPFESIKEAFG